MLKQLLLMVSLALSLPSIAAAQSGYTAVTAVVADSNGTRYVNSPYTVTFYDPGTSGKLPRLSGSTFQTSYNGYATDGSGNLSINLPDNGVIASTSGATNTQWVFSICTAVGAYTTQFCIPATKITITGNTQTISASLTAVAPILPVSSGGSGLSFVSTLPPLCTPGVTASVELSVAPYTINYCNAPNTWAALAAGGSVTNIATGGCLTGGPITSFGTISSGPTCALTTGSLAQFASTTSAQLRAVISDETGTGVLLFQNGNEGTPSAINLTNATNPPIWNQSTTGNAATATALATTPTQCGGVQVATGIAANGNANCVTPSANVSTSGSPSQYQVAAWASGLTILGIAPTANGQCFMSAASSFATSYPSFQTCPSGFSNPMTTLGDIIIENSTPAATRLAGPTTPNNVPETLIDTPSGGLATAEAWSLAGIPTNPQTGTSYTFGVTDRLSYVSFSNASAIAVTLPSAASSGFGSNFATVTCDIGVGTATITPTTSTISYSSGNAYVSGSATLALSTGQCATIYSDNTNYFAIVRTSTATVNSGTSTMATAAISSGTCATTVTTSATGVATTDTIQYTPNVNPQGVTGYAASASGSLYIWAYPTANNVNFEVCNNSSASITPAALTLNWRISR